jgi:hypothetical protein
VILKGPNLPFPNKGRLKIRLTGHRKQNGQHHNNQLVKDVQGENRPLL